MTSAYSNKKPSHISLELWNDMSADARYIAHKDASKRVGFIGVCYIALILPPILFMALPPVQALVNGKLAPSSFVKLNGVSDPRKFLDEATPKVDQVVAGFEISSEYGPRIHPITFEHTFHRGVDLATPTGTPLYAPAVGVDKVDINCWSDEGGGLVAVVNSASVPEYEFRALHLDTCESGVYSAGQKFATTGDTGNSTGPHLDFQQIYAGTDKRVAPYSGYLEWLVSGNAGALEAVDINALMSAISSQESGGDAGIVNSHSAAAGKFQIMPENIDGLGRGWDYEALGRDLTVEQMLGDEAVQDKIAEHKLSEIALSQSVDAEGKGRSPREIAERTAATWYSGDASLCSSTRPQYFGAGEYPSIAEYCNSIGDKFDSIQQKQQKRLQELDKK